MKGVQIKRIDSYASLFFLYPILRTISRRIVHIERFDDVGFNLLKPIFF